MNGKISNDSYVAIGYPVTTAKETNDKVAAEKKPDVSDVVLDKGGGLMNIFPLIYDLMAMLSVGLFMLVIVLVLLDIIMFAFAETIQKIKTSKRNYSLTFNDTNEYRLLAYASTYLSDEPYRVYTQKSLLNLSLAIVGFAIIVLGFQLGIFLVLKVRAISTGIPYTEELGIPRIRKSFGMMMCVLIGGLILLAVFKTYFTKTYQKRAQIIKAELAEIDATIFSNTLKDSALLTALTHHNMDLTYNIMERYVRNAKSTSNYVELQKLFFTMSLFNYFDSLSPLASESRQNVMSLFNVNNLSKKSVTPHSLFYYQGTNALENAFTTLKTDIVAKFGASGKNLLSDNELKNLESNVSVLIDGLNTNLLKLKKPGKLRTQFIIFNFVYLIVAILFAALLYFLFAKFKGKSGAADQGKSVKNAAVGAAANNGNGNGN